jgi:hypothetical protein
VAGCFAHGNEISAFVEGDKLPDQPHVSRLCIKAMLDEVNI